MQNLNCNQVLALLTFFCENRLNDNLMKSIEYHLNICQNCREKYFELRKVFINYHEIGKKIINDDNLEEISYKEKQYKDFKENLSAYIDNELDDKANLKIRKIAIVNIGARQELESFLSFRELLQECFEKTKNQLKNDFSEYTVNSIYNKINTNKKQIRYFKYVPILIGILSIIFFLCISICF